MNSYAVGGGRHYRRCPFRIAWGGEEDLQLHLGECDPETCEDPRHASDPCDCRERDEAAYWDEVNRRIDQERDK